MLEPWLSFFHLSAVLAWVVFASSQAALCRREWLNEAVVARLVRLDVVLWVATAAVLLTGLARMVWGMKGAGWYAANWLLHAKFTLLIVVALLMLGPARRFRQWRARLQAGGGLPPATEVAGARRLVMIETHLFALAPLAAVFMARGWGA
ncbi:MAG: DUF2214 family protein [Pseudomonadota bacterium]|nr:DUF2214 family protein [Pseudomonadota bacterium]